MKNQLFALFALLLIATTSATYIERTIYIPAEDMGVIKPYANGAFIRQQSMNGETITIGNEAGDNLVSDSRGYIVFDTKDIPRRAIVGQVNLTYVYESTTNGIKILKFADAFKRLGNTNVQNENWYYNASETWNASFKIIGNTVTGTETTTLALERGAPESTKLQLARQANENFSIALLLDKLENPLNTNVKIRGFANNKPYLAVQVFIPDPRGVCGNNVRGFRDTLLRYNANGWLLFNASSYDTILDIKLNNQLLDSNNVDWDVCFSPDGNNKFKFGANVTLTPVMRSRAVNLSIEVRTNYGFQVPSDFIIAFPNGEEKDVWDFTDLVEYAQSIGLTARSQWKDGKGYRIILEGFTNSTPLLLTLDPSIGETDWSNSSENVILADFKGGALYTPASCGTPGYGNCPQANYSGCANDGFACGNSAGAYGLHGLNDNLYNTGEYFQWKGSGDGGTLIGSQFPPGWIAYDVGRVVCVNQSAIADNSINAARQWGTGAYIYAGNSSLNFALKGVYDIVYSNTSLGTFGARNHTWSFTRDCARYWIFFLNATVGGSNGASLGEIAFRGTTYGFNHTSNVSATNQSANNFTVTFEFAYTTDFKNISNVTLIGNWSSTARYYGGYTNSSTIENVTIPVNLSGITAGTYSYYVQVLQFMNNSASSKWNTSTREFIVTNNTEVPLVVATNTPVPLTPTNNSNTQYAGLIPFTINVTFSNTNVSNVTLFGNFSGTWDANATNTTLLTESQNVQFSIGLTHGAYKWGARVCIIDGSCNYTTNFTLQILQIINNKSVILETPTDGTTLTKGSIQFKVNVSYQGVAINNVTLIGNFSGSWGDNESNTTTLSASPQDVYFTLGLDAGVYLWSAYLCVADGSCNYSNKNFTLAVSNGSIFWENITTETINFAETAWFNSTWFVETGSLSAYWFSTNITGSWVNDTSILFSEANNTRVNISKTGYGSDKTTTVVFYRIWATSSDLATNATPIGTLTILKTYNPTAYNQTLTQEVSNLIGSGMGIAFGDPFVIGIIVLLLFFGMLYAMGFTLDITIVVISLLIFGMAGLPTIAAKFPALQGWLSAVPLMIIAVAVFYALMKIARR